MVLMVTPEARCLRQRAQELANTPSIETALAYFRENPMQLESRASEFNIIIHSMNYLMDSAANGSSGLGKLAKLKQLCQEDLPSLSQLNSRSFASWQQAVDMTFRTVSQKLESGEWQVQDLTPGALASTLIIDGYGIMLEQKHQKQGIAELFPLAFEEVLVSGGWKETNFFKDMLPRIKERATLYALPVLNILTSLNEPGSIPDKNLMRVKNTVFNFLAPWKEREPQQPWDAISNLAIIVLERHPDIVMLTINQAKEIMGKEGVVVPAGFSTMQVVEKANTTIIKSRNILKKLENE